MDFTKARRLKRVSPLNGAYHQVFIFYFEFVEDVGLQMGIANFKAT